MTFANWTNAEIGSLLWVLVALLVAYAGLRAALKNPEGMRG
jgi:hypothetical protein